MTALPRPLVLLLLAAACSGEDEARRSEPLPVEPGGSGGTGGVPAPIVHAPPTQLDVEVLGPELDAPADVRDLAVGPDGAVWLVAADGLHVRPAGASFFERVARDRNGAGALPASVAALGPGVAVVGYPDGLARRVDRGTGVPTWSPLPIEGPVPRLEAVPAGTGRLVLAGAVGGLARIAADGAVTGPAPLPLPSSELWAVAVSGPDVWVGDAHRVARLTGALAGPLDGSLPTPSVDLAPDEPDWTTALAVCPNGEVWASALGHGVFRLSPIGVVLERFTAADVLPQDHVLALACDLDGSVWFGTSWGGLARRSPDGTFAYHAASAGLPGDSVRRLLVVPDGGGGRTLWIATEGGAAAYHGP